MKDEDYNAGNETKEKSKINKTKETKESKANEAEGFAKVISFEEFMKKKKEKEAAKNERIAADNLLSIDGSLKEMLSDNNVSMAKFITLCQTPVESLRMFLKYEWLSERTRILIKKLLKGR